MSTTRTNRRYWIVFSLLLIYNLWLAAQIPYGIDDWSWGGSNGFSIMLSRSLNNRFAGNTSEILLARYPLLKTLVMGLSFTLIPASALSLASDAWEIPEAESCVPFLLLLGSFLMLTIPRSVWAQGYSWVAGFSNFALSGLLLCWYHRLLLRGELHGRFTDSLPARIGLVLFVFALEFYIENLSIYVFLLTGLLLLLRLVRRKPAGLLIPLFVASAVGLALMFSNTVFVTLLRDGSALDGYRTLTYDKDAGLYSIALNIITRFLGDISNKLWGGNWIMCTLIVLCLLGFALRRRQTVFYLPDALFIFYFPFSHFHGSVPLPSFSPIHYLSGLAEPLFFVVVLLQVYLFWREERRVWLLLAASWIAVPVLIAPMVAINSAGPRIYLTTDILLMQFCTLLAARLWIELGHKARRVCFALCALALTAVCIQRAVVYAQIGETKRERDALIREGIETHAREITLPAFPHGDYLWITGAEYGPQVPSFNDFYFNDFYGIDPDVILYFEKGYVHTAVFY